MSTPLYDALALRAGQGKVRFHMPGHKGKDVFESSLAGAARLDFTELYGTGNLYDGTYPISDAETLYAEAFGVPHAYFLTGGTTQGVYAAARLAIKPGDRVLIDRGCHKSVYRALALFGASPTYLVPKLIEPYHIPCAITPQQVEAALAENPDISCVILTCPTYYGVVCDLRAISEAVHRRGARLIVDSAHGAHFPFTPDMACATALGADIAVTSLHKTLPALGQAAVITTNGDYSPEAVRRATSLFGTSSPSYAVMASMDLTREYMLGEGRERIAVLAARLAALRERINRTGGLSALINRGGDPLRLCVCTAGLDLSGYAAAAYLEDSLGVVCEMADARNVLFIITPADSDEDIDALEAALEKLAQLRGAEALSPLPQLPMPRIHISPREAMFMPAESVELSQAVGRIAAESICPYPPGIPAAAAGEVIEAEHIEYLYQSGFYPDDRVDVICI